MRLVLIRTWSKVDNLYKDSGGEPTATRQTRDAMAAKLKAAGFDTYTLLRAGTAVSSVAKKSVDELAREVIQGFVGKRAGS